MMLEGRAKGLLVFLLKALDYLHTEAQVIHTGQHRDQTLDRRWITRADIFNRSQPRQRDLCSAWQVRPSTVRGRRAQES